MVDILTIEWDGDRAGNYYSAEVDHPAYPDTLCPCVERLQCCPDNRWMFSVDVPDFVGDEPLCEMRPRSIAAGLAYSLTEAVVGAETAIRRIISGISLV